jgi:metal-sulfur cluster biosynthetic enzyme
MGIRDQVIEQIRLCFDPEIPVNVYDLGLVYEVKVKKGSVDIEMTFTSESCPSAREIPEDIRRRVCSLDKVKECNFDIVWEPEWHPRMISEEARAELGIDEDAL